MGEINDVLQQIANERLALVSRILEGSEVSIEVGRSIHTVLNGATLFLSAYLTKGGCVAYAGHLQTTGFIANEVEGVPFRITDEKDRSRELQTGQNGGIYFELEDGTQRITLAFCANPEVGRSTVSDAGSASPISTLAAVSIPEYQLSAATSSTEKDLCYTVDGEYFSLKISKDFFARQVEEAKPKRKPKEPKTGEQPAGAKAKKGTKKSNNGENGFGMIGIELQIGDVLHRNIIPIHLVEDEYFAGDIDLNTFIGDYLWSMPDDVSCIFGQKEMVEILRTLPLTRLKGLEEQLIKKDEWRKQYEQLAKLACRSLVKSITKDIA